MSISISISISRLNAAVDDVSHGMSYPKAAAKWSVGQTTLFKIVKNPNHRLEKYRVQIEYKFQSEQ
jgi:hypothetical protein